MSTRRPPQLAVWLLQRTGTAAWNAPLIGDLLEEFHRGRTSGWYWRQTGMAIFAALITGLRIRRLDIVPWFVGWCVETAVLVGLWLCDVPFGLRSAWVAGIAFGGAWLVMYVDYRVRLHLWQNESEMNDEESDLFWDRRIGTRFMALGGFGAYLLVDAVWGLVDILLGFRSSLPFLATCRVLWIGGFVVRAAMRFACEESEQS